MFCKTSFFLPCFQECRTLVHTSASFHYILCHRITYPQIRRLKEKVQFEPMDDTRQNIRYYKFVLCPVCLGCPEDYSSVCNTYKFVHCTIVLHISCYIKYHFVQSALLWHYTYLLFTFLLSSDVLCTKIPCRILILPSLWRLHSAYTGATTQACH